MSLRESAAGSNGLSYCGALVREHARERYLGALLAPPAQREALFALYAFDHEIARVRHVVSQPMAGLIRLQWWRDAFDAISIARAPAQPVAQELEAVWNRLEAARPQLDAALDARERELEDEPFADLEDLGRHQESVSGGIITAALHVLGADAPAVLEAGRRAGIALGMVAVLRALPRDAADRRLLVPTVLVQQEEVERVVVFQGRADAALRRAVERIGARALAEIRTIRAQRQQIAPEALPALLPLLLAEDYLRRLARAGNDPFAPAPARATVAAPLKILWRGARRRL